MAIAFDKESFLDFTTTADGSYTHTPVGTPRGVICLIAQNGSTDVISGVTYGGVALSRLQTNSDTAGEQGRSWIYFLGSGIPTGAQTVAVTVTALTVIKTIWTVTVTAARDTAKVANGGVNEDAANPSVTLATAASFAGICLSVFFSGLAAPTDGTITAGSGYTKLAGSAAGGRDFGSSAAAAEYKLASGANVVANWTSAVDDCAMSAVAVAEVAASLIASDLRVRGNSLLRRCSGLLVPDGWDKRILVPQPAI